MAVFNVRDFGATGNGTTDDTVAIVAAISATVASNKYGPNPRGQTVTIDICPWQVE